MENIKLSTLIQKAGYNLDLFKSSVGLRIEIDFDINLSFPNRNYEDYPYVALHFPGFGQATSENDTSYPVLIEYPNGNGNRFPVVVVWTDINEEDGTKLTLENADVNMYVPPSEN